MGYLNTLSKTFRVLGFDAVAMTDLANDQKATGHGFLTLALVGLAGGIMSFLLQLVFSFGSPAWNSLFVLLYMPFYTIVGFIIGYSIYHMLAKLFKGQATGAQYFRVMSNCMLVTVISLIPILGWILQWIVGLYLIVINIFVMRNVHQLSWARSVIVVLIPVIVSFVLAFVGLLFFIFSVPRFF